MSKNKGLRGPIGPNSGFAKPVTPTVTPPTTLSQEHLYIYSKPGCGYCSHLSMFLETRGVKYTMLNLHSDFTQEEFINKFGRGSSFPQVTYKNEKLGGMRDTVKYVAENLLR